jgi:hypothetical protein
MELSAGAAIVRPWRADDAGALQRQAKDRRVSVNLRDAFPASVHAGARGAVPGPGRGHDAADVLRGSAVSRCA